MTGRLIASNALANAFFNVRMGPVGCVWPPVEQAEAIIEAIKEDPEARLERVVQSLCPGHTDPEMRVCRFAAVGEGARPSAILATCEMVASGAIGPTAPQELGKNLLTANLSGNVAAWTLDTATDRFEASDQFFQVLGLEPQSVPLTGADMQNRLHPDVQDFSRSQYAALIKGKIESLNFDLRVQRFDRKWIWINMSARLRDRSHLGLKSLVCGTITDITDRKESEARLEAALLSARTARQAIEKTRKEARDLADMFRFSVANGQIGPFSFCPQSDEGWMMDETYRMMGYEPGEFAPSWANRLKLLHPDDLASGGKGIQALIDGDIDVYDNETRQRHKDGTYHWYRSICRLVDRSDQNLPPMVAGVTTKIDALKENAQKLAEALSQAEQNRDRLNHLADNAPTALYEYRKDPKGRETLPYFSARLPEIFGVTAQQIRQDRRNLFRHVLKEDVAAYEDGWQRAAQDETNFRCNLRVAHPKLGLRWLQLSSVPQKGVGRRIIRYASVSDVTEQHEAEQRASEAAEALRSAHDRLNKLTENVPVGIYDFRIYPDGTVALPYFNTKLADLLGLTPEEISSDGMAAFRNILKDDEGALQQAIETSRLSMTPFECQFRVCHPKLGVIWLLTRANPFEGRDGTTIWYGSTYDITDRLEMERAALTAAEEVQSAHKRLNNLTENTPAGLFEFQLGVGGCFDIRYCNSQFSNLMGFGKDDIQMQIGFAFKNVVQDDVERLSDVFNRAYKDGKAFEAHFRVRHADHRELSLLITAVPKSDAGDIKIWYGSAYDLTERLEMERRSAEAARQVEAAHARLGSIADAAPVGIFEMHRAASGDLSLEYSSARFDNLVGLGAGNPVQKMSALRKAIHPDDRDSFMVFDSGDPIKQGTQTLGIQTRRFRIVHPERGLRWISASMIPSEREDGTIALNGAYVDVTKDVEREDELRRAHELAERMRSDNEHQALHDSLTGLPNRRYFDKMLAGRFRDMRYGGLEGDVVLIRIDGDRFKYINDTFGHEAGDAVLQRISEVLELETRGSDFPARIGGDEFSILLAHRQTEEDARALIMRIQKGLAVPLVFEGRRCTIQASFGIASVNGKTETSGDLLAFADAALYKAKEQGRNRMELFTPDLRQAIFGTRRMAIELQDAIARDEFEPFFQVQIDCHRHELSGVEVLLRWRHPERGVLAPDSFMAVAEQLRIVPDLDKLMLHKARAGLAQLRSHGLQVPKISFNVSSGRMQDPDVVASARNLIEDGVKVTFELLESTFVEDAGDVFKFHLDQLRDAGIDIEIDDFGSGHASIIALMSVAPSALKIDRRIVAPIAEDLRAQKLLRAIIEIAETLDINTIAEGVETAEQVEIVHDLGCHIVQGFYYSRPVSLLDFEQLLRSQPWTSPEGMGSLASA